MSIVPFNHVTSPEHALLNDEIDRVYVNTPSPWSRRGVELDFGGRGNNGSPRSVITRKPTHFKNMYANPKKCLAALPLHTRPWPHSNSKGKFRPSGYVGRH